MPVGSNYPFLQYSDSTTTTLTTAGVTVTFCIGAQPDPMIRLQNMSTATVWIGIGTRSTSSAAVTTKGLMLPPTNQPGCLQIIRAGGVTTFAAFTLGATQTAVISSCGGEGML